MLQFEKEGIQKLLGEIPVHIGQELWFVERIDDDEEYRPRRRNEFYRLKKVVVDDIEIHVERNHSKENGVEFSWKLLDHLTSYRPAQLGWQLFPDKDEAQKQADKWTQERLEHFKGAKQRFEYDAYGLLFAAPGNLNKAVTACLQENCWECPLEPLMSDKEVDCKDFLAECVTKRLSESPDSVR